MDFISKILSSYFTAENWLSATIEGVLFVIGIYGLFKLFLFILRYYIIYNIAKKLAGLLKLKNPPLEQPKPTEKEDELLRDEEKEIEKEADVEKVTVEKLRKDKKEGKAYSNKSESQEQEGEFKEADFKIHIPKAIGKWQKLVLGNRQNMIIAVAKKMQETRNPNFWQTLVDVQREQAGTYRGRQ
jgi:hypothetical protein